MILPAALTTAILRPRSSSFETTRSNSAVKAPLLQPAWRKEKRPVSHREPDENSQLRLRPEVWLGRGSPCPRICFGSERFVRVSLQRRLWWRASPSPIVALAFLQGHRCYPSCALGSAVRQSPPRKNLAAVDFTFHHVAHPNYCLVVGSFDTTTPDALLAVGLFLAQRR